MKFVLALTTVAALSATAAVADDISLTAPQMGATLHEGGIDMSVYWTDTGAGYEVVATYTPGVSTYAPRRMIMLMQDGDAVAFGVPDARDVFYRFARVGDSVQVSADRTGLQFASN
ncbi:hypothetical protein [Puniceibacterium sp. IMCC21224]|uniref:hypothetical protein n=1 Tax=Puniceibacterium sp. IMCC21224 TaxID=1618204 RepID=UPI00064DF2D6|nr:hypothetical protein [Puniceibacterium sp. IMCC21224]KMK65349.1 hypothetical protein IMCC21224_11180 [Puniceibacterium sp. IMCC21224]